MVQLRLLVGRVNAENCFTGLSVSERSLRRRWQAHKAGNRLESSPKTGRPQTISRVAKIVISNRWEKGDNQRGELLLDYPIADDRLKIYCTPLSKG